MTPRGFFAAALALTWTGSAAAADTAPDPERARAIFQEARALRDTGKYAEACAKFEESLTHEMGIGTQYNLADCWERLGRTASAHAKFLEVKEKAAAAGQAERAAVAAERAKVLEPKLVRLVVQVKEPPPKLEITKDGAELKPSRWGSPDPIDPGTHEIRVTAPGKKPWSSKVEAWKPGDTVTVDVPALDDEGEGGKAAAVPAKKPAPKEKAEATPAPERAPSHGGETRDLRGKSNLVPVLLWGGVGAGALLAGTSLVLYKLSNDQAEGVCPTGTGCSRAEIARHRELVDDARTARSLSYLGFGIAGAALITVGAVSLSEQGSPERVPRAAFRAAPFASPDGAGAAVSGTF